MTEQKIKLLFVADDNIDRTAFASFVKKEGLPYLYTLAGSASDADEKLTSKHFDIMLLHISPGNETGFNLLKRTNHAPVIVIINAGYEDIAVKAMRKGAHGYLIKDPKNGYLKILPITIEKALQQKKAENALLEYQDHLEEMIEKRTFALQSEIDEGKRIGAARDINEHLKVQEEKERIQAQLFQSQKMDSLGTLVAGMAHEINNPVSSIMLNTPVLKRILNDIHPILEAYSNQEPSITYGGFSSAYLKDNLDQLLSDISDGADRIAMLVKRLKDFARKTDIIEKNSMNLNEAVENAVKLSHATARKSAIDLMLIPGNDLPAMIGHRQSIEQIALNLIINAIQAIDHDNGKITVTTGCRKTDQHLFIKVSDNGRGIDPSIHDKIFDPFVTTRQTEGGTGLGLSVTYTLVNEHDGEITFQSRNGRGTTFTVLFPTAKRRHPAKILVVDDEPRVRRMLIKTLAKDRAYNVQEAADGIEALIKIGIEQPDLLILDIMMPKMDGLEVCKAIKNSSKLSDMDTIIITGLPDDPKLKKIADLGFTDICPKPFDREELLARVHRILTAKG